MSGAGQLCSARELYCIITSIQSCNQTPITSPHFFPLLSPSFTPLHAVTVVASFSFGPEAKVERRNEKNPIETFASSYVGRREVVRGTKMQWVCSPYVRSVFFRDNSVVNLQKSDYQPRYPKSIHVRTYFAALSMPVLFSFTRSVC